MPVAPHNLISASDLVFLRTPGASDVLTLDPDAEKVHLAGNTAGMDHWGFVVKSADELENAKQEVEAAGGKYLRSDRPADMYIEDPDGYVVQLFKA